MSTTTNIKPLTQRPAWKALAAHHEKIKKPHRHYNRQGYWVDDTAAKERSH